MVTSVILSSFSETISKYCHLIFITLQINHEVSEQFLYAAIEAIGMDVLVSLPYINFFIQLMINLVNYY